MIISHAKRFIIFAPWKTASSTLSARLASYDEGLYNPFYHYNLHLQRVVHQHLTCADFAALPESRLGFFVASFVRNPYDRSYSGFLQIQRDIVEQPLAAFPTPFVRELVLQQLEANRAQLAAARWDFDLWMASLKDFQVFEVGHNSSLPLHPANYWTHLGGRQLANFIGKTEKFEADFSTLCSILKIDEPERINRNVSNTSELKSSNERGYRYIHLMNRRSIEKINHLFRDDFELFDYEMVREIAA